MSSDDTLDVEAGIRFRTLVSLIDWPVAVHFPRPARQRPCSREAGIWPPHRRCGFQPQCFDVPSLRLEASATVN